MKYEFLQSIFCSVDNKSDFCLVQFLWAWSMRSVWPSIVQLTHSAFFHQMFRVSFRVMMLLEEQVFCSVLGTTHFHQVNVWYLLVDMTSFHCKFHTHYDAKCYFEDYDEGLHRFECCLIVFWYFLNCYLWEYHWLLFPWKEMNEEFANRVLCSVSIGDWYLLKFSKRKIQDSFLLPTIRKFSMMIRRQVFRSIFLCDRNDVLRIFSVDLLREFCC